ncbi:pirin family protein [Sinimarinibacterium thermocellulolyticum]|uniref:Pirin family protein n=1 Tax=Sinimarinibacterium thermocellulolyticum TaxID=3170016 RepID=A0ABV2A6R1_9GAMM
MTPRLLQRIIPSVETSDGAGVKLRRSIGATPALRLDPFLMLDEFGTENPDDYIAGFPPHPHRGFETVTYMIDGHMRHEDHLGNVGELKSGGVQWMTAGRGVIHSEMPQQESGRMRGFQLWINLPAREKMKPAAYRDIPADAIPAVALSDGGYLKLIAGRVQHEGRDIAGPINAEPGAMATDPLYLDIGMASGATITQPVPCGHNALVYVYEGELQIGERALPRHVAGVLSDGDAVTVRAGVSGARYLLLAGKPLREPVVQYGPFVMNTRDEIEEAIDDYRRGRLTA